MRGCSLLYVHGQSAPFGQMPLLIINLHSPPSATLTSGCSPAPPAPPEPTAPLAPPPPPLLPLLPFGRDVALSGLLSSCGSGHGTKAVAPVVVVGGSRIFIMGDEKSKSKDAGRLLEPSRIPEASSKL